MLLDEIAKLIDDSSTEFSVGTNLFKGFESSHVLDTALFVHEYGGRSPELVFSSSTPAYEIPRVQVVSRSSDYQTARNNIETIYRLMIGQTNITLKPSTGATGTKYLSISPIQSPFYLNQDENERHRCVCNFEVMKLLST